MRNPSVRSWLCLAAMSLLVGSLGCYESIYRVSAIADAKVDRELCGDWKLAAPGGGEIFMGVRNIDDKFYAVSWRSAGEDRAAQLVADSTAIQGARFVHARTLPDDGGVADTAMLLRVDLEGDRITIRTLNEEFINGKAVNSDESLRAVVEGNLENNDLYDDSVYAGERVIDGH